MNLNLLSLRNGESAFLSDLPLLSEEDFRSVVLAEVEAGARVVAWFRLRDDFGKSRLVGVLARDERGDFALAETVVVDQYDSFTPICPQLQIFERVLAESEGIVPVGHPWLKPVRFPDADGENIGKMDFYRIGGEAVHEVAVGPVHAGVIEPGHFRFQCYGETVHHLEISLGYQHRGIARALIGGPDRCTVHYVETTAGDSSIAHATAYAQALEALAGVRPSQRAEQIRGIALELERMANHTGDLGALAGDVGYLPTASFCGRLRGDLLNLTALICGNRFGRGLVRPGGVGYDIDEERADFLYGRLEKIFADVRHAVELLWDTPSVLARFENTGCLSLFDAIDMGLVGLAARACGCERDVRYSHPNGIYARSHLPISTAETGDVLGRAFVRWLELQRSYVFLREELSRLTVGEPMTTCPALTPDRITVSTIEAWRGEICHVAVTDDNGKFLAYEIIDPSLHNWSGLALSLRGEEISDFPLCNKSFNLSYCGHDL